MPRSPHRTPPLPTPPSPIPPIPFAAAGQSAARKKLRQQLLGSAASVVVSLGAAPVLAQSGYQPTGETTPVQLPTLPVDAAATTGTGGDYKMDQPTIPKLTEPLLNTPQTIEVITRQTLDDQGVVNFRDALRNVPGISIAAGEGSSQGDSLTIRGFTARNDIYLDGMRDFGSYYRDPFYLEDIQVLKGPAGILFGRGSTGGVVEQDSKMPKLTPFYTGTAVLGSDLTHRATADVNQPLPELGEGAALRLNAMVHDNQFAGRDVARNDRFGLAPSLALGLGTPTRFTLTYLHQQEYDTPDYGLPWLYVGTAGTPTAIGRPPPLSLTSSNYYGFAAGNYLRTNVDVATSKFEHDFNDAITFSDQLRYASYRRAFDITEPQIYTAASATTPGATGVAQLIAPGTPLSALTVSRNQLAGRSQETFLENQSDVTARFATGPIGHTLRAGVEIGRETSDPTRYSTIGPYSTTSLLAPTPGDQFNAVTYLSSNTSTTALTQALYALDTLKFDEHWELMAGVRWDRFDSKFDQVTFANPVTLAGAASAAFTHVDSAITWRGALVYKPRPEGSVYFDAGTSFNPSAEALSLSMATAPLPPVQNQSYELGTKWDLLGGGLAFTGALFHSEQLNVREPNPNNPLFNILAGDAVAKGLELLTTGHLTPEWEIIAGYAYTYSVITKSPVVGPASDLGHALANTPRHTANLWAEYHLPWWKLEVGGGINVVSSRYAATTPTTAGGVAFFKEVPGYFTLQAMAKLPLNDHVSLQLNLYNLTDNKYYDQLHPAHVVPGAGRTALLTLAFKY
jgi:catecholate siderophore receptor